MSLDFIIQNVIMIHIILRPLLLELELSSILQDLHLSLFIMNSTFVLLNSGLLKIQQETVLDHAHS